MENLAELLNEHLKSRNVFKNDTSWIIKCSDLKGRGLFANRDIKCGEIIFQDSPLLIGPRLNNVSEEICIVCYKTRNLHFCSRNCGIRLCSKKCQNTRTHRDECRLINQWKSEQDVHKDILKCLTPVRGLLLDNSQMNLLKCLKSHDGPQHGLEVSIIKEKLKMQISEEEEKLLNLICSVLDTNAFEIVVGEAEETSSLRGIYPLSSLMNHMCVPNTTHYFDSKLNMIVKATRFIPKDQEISHSYTITFWGTYLRRPYLFRTKHFICSCLRCQDPTENNTYLGAINCLKCKGYVLPLFIKNLKMIWKCTRCNKIIPTEKAFMIMSMLGNRFSDLETSNPEEILEFLKGTLLKYAPACSQIGVQLKCKLMWMLGHKQSYFWGDLSEELLNEKESICRELLELLEKLGAGKNKMRGLISYELYCCLKERQRRLKLQEIDTVNESFFEEQTKEMASLFEESREILTDDVHAPPEIKSYNSSTNTDKTLHNDELILAG